MTHQIKNFLKKIFTQHRYGDIHPDEIFLDSKNLPAFDVYQFEGRIEKPISFKTFVLVGLSCLFIGLVFIFRFWNLQFVNGKIYAEQAINNSLKQTLIFASRGIIVDRNGIDLVWNTVDSLVDFPKREFITKNGFSHLLGFIKYPAKDTSGFYYRENYEASGGAEKVFDYKLAGKNGLKLTETDVFGNVISESVINKPIDGEKIELAIDSRIQEKMYQEIKSLADRVGFRGGAGIIMDVNSGEIITLTNYPEYDPNIMTEGREADIIEEYSTSPNMPFLNRSIAGLYAPGSIVKPFLAFAALEEKIISPEKEIVSTGRLVIPNPYFPDKPSIFLDWKAHGATDMRKAIAVSSDVYFYQIGGGFGNQQGLGVSRIKKYMQMFGFARPTGINIGSEEIGNIPDPQWKMKIFDEEWRLGDTYNTSIGQYGTQITPIQAVRAIAALANNGILVTPTILKKTSSIISNKEVEKINIKDQLSLQIAREGMRLAVTEGTSLGLNVPYVKIAGKTGTAELGVKKDRVNSWTIGFFPYENPKYAYVVIMESGPVKNLVGATSVMRQVMDFMHINTPEYFEN